MKRTPLFGHPNNGVLFYYGKTNKRSKIKLYKKQKQGCATSSLSQEYQISISSIKYLIRLIDRHGFDILRKNKNNYYSPRLK